MSKLSHYSEADHGRIKMTMTKLVEGQIRAGLLDNNPAAIMAVLPQAMEDAIEIFHAVDEYLCC
jgi:hypothetical protein